MEPRDLIGVQEMALRLGVTAQTVYNYIERGKIPATRMRRGLRTRLVVLRADFERVAPGLLGIDRSDTLDEDTRKPTMEAAIA